VIRDTLDDVPSEHLEARRHSAALFGNEKLIEVVLALEDDDLFPATAQSVAARTGIAHNLAGAVLRKLAAANLLTPLPRTSSRGPAYFVARDQQVWEQLVRLCRAVEHADALPSSKP
jgi:hypothetical protein